MKNILTDQSGQAAIIGVVFLLAMSVITSTGLASFSVRETRGSRLLFSSLGAHASAESGVEDVSYRIANNLNVDDEEILLINNYPVTTTVTTAGSEKHVLGDGSIRNATRRIQSILTENTVDAEFHYGVQVGYGGLSMSNNTEVRGSVFSNGDITAGNNAVITGDAWVAEGTASTPDQSQTTQTHGLNLRDTTATRDAAQGFVPTITANMTRVDFYIRKMGTPSNASIHIVEDDNGLPQNSDSLSDGTLTATNVTTNYGWVSVTLTPVQPLVAGNTYWVIIDNGSNSATNYYVLGGALDASYTPSTFKYSADWSNGSPVWATPGQGARDGAFRIYMGSANTKIDGSVVKGNAHANTIENATIDGDAYYQTISGSTVGGASFSGSADPAPENLPFSDAELDEFKSWGDAGGACAPPDCDSYGDYRLENGASSVLGPIRITGDMTIDTNAILTVNGTIHVEGNLTFDNNCAVSLSPSYGILSGIIIVDGTIDIQNNCALDGSGNPQSYMILITTSEQIASPPAMLLQNNSAGAIFYAAKGTAVLENNAEVKEVIGQRIEMINNAVLIYESGLANVQFSAGPTGGFSIDRWNEVE